MSQSSLVRGRFNIWFTYCLNGKAYIETVQTQIRLLFVALPGQWPQCLLHMATTQVQLSKLFNVNYDYFLINEFKHVLSIKKTVLMSTHNI